MNHSFKKQNSQVNFIAKCLLNEPANLPIEVAYVKNTEPGDIWTPDDVCQMAFGPGATYCRVCF